MLAAVCDGDAKKVAELMRQDPGFKVNMDQGYGVTLLHHACGGDSSSPAIPVLLAHPGIDVNLKDIYGWTPFDYACWNGSAFSVREMLRDSRVMVNEPTKDGFTPLWYAASHDHLDIIKWWIVSGREMDFGKPGDVDKTDAIGAAKKRGNSEVVTLLERFKENPVETRHQVRVQLGLVDELAAEVFAMVVFVSDGLLQINGTTPSPAARFFSIASQLPLELQMVLCYRQVGSAREIIPRNNRELAFRNLAIGIDLP